MVPARPEAEGPLLPGLACSLALDVDDLPQCVPDLHQVGGIGHDPDDVFAGSGDLVGERVRVPRNSKARARREVPEFHLPGRGTESGPARSLAVWWHPRCPRGPRP